MQEKNRITSCKVHFLIYLNMGFKFMIGINLQQYYYISIFLNNVYYCMLALFYIYIYAYIKHLHIFRLFGCYGQNYTSLMLLKII